MYFEVHQPYRLRRFSYFDRDSEQAYFDEAANADILRKVARKCYLPTNALIRDLIERHDGRFRVSYSITGVALEQFEEYAPEVLKSFQQLAATGCVEFVGETYYHSLAALYDWEEFDAQVDAHRRTIERLFGQTPQVFRNTELIYNDEIGRHVASKGYKGIIAEGADDILGWRSPNFVYRVPGTDMSLLLKNYRLSDDIAFRFSNREWKDYPLLADKFSGWVHNISGAGEVVNLFMDYETFGEHQWEATGIFEFLNHFPEQILKHPHWNFATPTEAVTAYTPVADLSYHRTTSWADVERDITAWRGNRMQAKALDTIYHLKQVVAERNDDELLHAWRKLQTSDHFYYMCTKWFADGDVHAYFSPFDSPYDAFIVYENVLRNFESSLREEGPVTAAAS
jgi:alpha-amylase